MMKKKKILKIILLITGVVLGVSILIIGSNYFKGKRNLKENASAQENAAYETISYQGRNYFYRDDFVNILCLGIDKEEEMSVRNDMDNSVGQADAIFLMSLDLKNNEIRLFTIPRDTMVTLQMYNSEGSYRGSRSGQLALQYAYGDGTKTSASLMTSQVSDLFYQIPIHAYMAINVYSLYELNDVVGGIDMMMDRDYTMFHPDLKEGTMVHLTGKALECYLRGRDINVFGTAYTRTYRLKQYMLAYFDKAKEALKEDIRIPFRCLEVLEKNMETNITEEELFFLISEIMNCSFSEETMYMLPGEQIWTGTYEEYHADKDALAELVVQLFYE